MNPIYKNLFYRLSFNRKTGRALLIVAWLIFACGNLAQAHPLGNFSVNQFNRIEVDRGEIRLRAIVDMAEIPAFQTAQTADTDKNGALSDQELKTFVDALTPKYVENLRLLVDGALLEIQVSNVAASQPPGAADLPTLRIEWNLNAVLPGADSDQMRRVRFINNNFAERLGWNEIVVNRTANVNVFDSTAFGNSITDELKTYPENLLNAPLAERAAEFSISQSAILNAAKPLRNRDGQTSAPIAKDRFAALIAAPEITLQVALAGLLLAVGFGALHALAPGHGKAVVAAYLVGSRGTAKHAIFLGVTVTVTHTLGVFALGLVTVFAASFILPERLMPVLNFVSGLLVLLIGVALFKNRLFERLGYESKIDHEHEAEFDDENGFVHTHGGSTHAHLPPKQISWRSLLALGVSGGLLPCPSALVLMLSAIWLGRTGYGLLLTLAFSVGLAATLTTVGLLFLRIGKLFDNATLADNRIVKTLPVLSAFVIACIGAFMCYSSLI